MAKKQFSFTHKHYVPIIKAKAGERWALSHLTPQGKPGLTPLIELHGHDSKTVAAHADSICEDLAAAWGTEDPFFFDAVWLHGDEGNPAIISAVFAAARTHNLLAIPVVRTSYSASALAQVAAVVEEDDRSCLLRITPLTLSAPAMIAGIDAVLTELELTPTNVHLLLDYQRHAMNLSVNVPQIPHLAGWQTFTTASGVFPRSLIGVGAAGWDMRSRGCWNSWEPEVTGGALPRDPTFGDFTVRDPGAPADFGDPIVNIRYTTDDAWLIRTGGKFKLGHSGDMNTICHELIARPEYSGAAFSGGDMEFYNAAQPHAKPGGPTQWVQWSVSHHMEFVSQQIQSHAGI